MEFVIWTVQDVLQHEPTVARTVYMEVAVPVASARCVKVYPVLHQHAVFSRLHPFSKSQLKIKVRCLFLNVSHPSIFSSCLIVSELWVSEYEYNLICFKQYLMSTLWCHPTIPSFSLFPSLSFSLFHSDFHIWQCHVIQHQIDIHVVEAINIYFSSKFCFYILISCVCVCVRALTVNASSFISHWWSPQEFESCIGKVLLLCVCN